MLYYVYLTKNSFQDINKDPVMKHINDNHKNEINKGLDLLIYEAKLLAYTVIKNIEGKEIEGKDIGDASKELDDYASVWGKSSNSKVLKYTEKLIAKYLKKK